MRQTTRTRKSPGEKIVKDIRRAITDAIGQYAISGVPQSIERDTVLYGMTLFGDPGSKT